MSGTVRDQFYIAAVRDTVAIGTIDRRTIDHQFRGRVRPIDRRGDRTTRRDTDLLQEVGRLRNNLNQGDPLSR